VEDGRRRRPQLLAVAQVEVDRRLGDEHHRVDAHALELACQQLGQRRPACAAEARGVDRLVHPDHRPLVPLGDRAAHGTVDRYEGRQVGIGAADHQHLRGLAGAACGGGLGNGLRLRRGRRGRRRAGGGAGQ
jgi:hypothetical protein